MSSAYQVKQIQARETWPLRQKVLRPLWRPEQCANEGDEDPMTLHLGLSYAGNLASIATFVMQPHPDFSAGCPYRLRGMATDEKWRGQGFGSILLRQGVEVLRERYCDFIWFNARIRAFRFYESLGFQYWGSMFEMSEIGLHKVMYKHLIRR